VSARRDFQKSIGKTKIRYRRSTEAIVIASNTTSNIDTHRPDLYMADLRVCWTTYDSRASPAAYRRPCRCKRKDRRPLPMEPSKRGKPDPAQPRGFHVCTSTRLTTSPGAYSLLSSIVEVLQGTCLHLMELFSCSIHGHHLSARCRAVLLRPCRDLDQPRTPLSFDTTVALPPMRLILI
jgi:hypothetical protein